jgi:hypothetical protein
MRCPERTRLFDHFERTAKAFAEAVSGLREVGGYDALAQQRLVAHIRSACDGAQTALLRHEEAHRCTDIGAEKSSEQSELVRG